MIKLSYRSLYVADSRVEGEVNTRGSVGLSPSYFVFCNAGRNRRKEGGEGGRGYLPFAQPNDRA